MRWTLLIALLCTGCVGKKKYDELAMQLQTSQSELAETQKERDGLKTDLQALVTERDALQSNLNDTVSARDQLRTRLAGVEDQLSNMRGEKAKLLTTRSKLQASINEMTTALEELAARKAKADARVAAFRDLVSRFKELIDAGKLQVRIIDGRMVVQLATDVLFSSGSASLNKEGRDAIRGVADVLKSIPDRKFQVEGHTDNVPIRTERYPSNWTLASARAITVVDEMLEVGMPADRISAASYGEFDPVAPNRTDDGRSANRRIQIVVLPDLSALPGYGELQELEAD